MHEIKNRVLELPNGDKLNLSTSELISQLLIVKSRLENLRDAVDLDAIHIEMQSMVDDIYICINKVEGRRDDEQT